MNLMETLTTVISQYLYPTVLVVFFFGFTVFVHELGHFWVARRRGMKVERFSIGFGPRIFGWTKDGIEYRVSWIPFGGYVVLPQMSPMEAIEGKSETPKEPLPPAPPSSKILVAFAGPVMNVLLAIVLAFVIWGVGLPQPINPPVVGWLEPGGAEEKAGLQVGDRIKTVNGEAVDSWLDMQRVVMLSRENTVRLKLDRAGQELDVEIERTYNKEMGANMVRVFPEGRPYVSAVYSGSPAEKAGVMARDKILAIEGMPVSTSKDLIAHISKRADQPTELQVMRAGKIMTILVTPRVPDGGTRAFIGIGLNDEMEFKVVRPGPKPQETIGEVLGMIGHTFYALRHAKETGVGVDSFRGPLGIGAGWWKEIQLGGIMRGVWFAVVINVLLAVFNLLPIPVLDGGHIMFACYEVVLRRPVNARFAYATTTAFAFLLIGFMLYISFHDVRRDFIPTRTKPAPQNLQFENIEKNTEP